MVDEIAAADGLHAAAGSAFFLYRALIENERRSSQLRTASQGGKGILEHSILEQATFSDMNFGNLPDAVLSAMGGGVFNQVGEKVILMHNEPLLLNSGH